MSAQRYKVRVDKDDLVFSAGHFITFAGDQCERIHGHNYRATVEVEDDLDENHYVFDFIALRDITRVITGELDHRMLLPTENPLVRLETEGENIVARYKHRHYSFPREDVVLLPIPNTTAEMLARHLCGRARQRLAEHGATNLHLIEIEVEESPGQSAVYRERFQPAAS